MGALYKLTARYSAVLDQLEDTEGEIAPDLELALEEAGGNLVAKIDACAAMVISLRADAERFGDEERRFVRKRERAEARARWLEGQILAALVVAGETKVKGPRFLVSRQKNPASVELSVEPEALPERFLRTVVKTSTSADKRALLAALEAGETIEGARRVQRERTVIR